MRRPRALALPYSALPFSVRVGGLHPFRFGNGRRWLREWAETLPRGLSDNAKLFVGAYAAGFVGVSLFIA